MTAIVAIVCVTVLLLAVTVGVFLERHRRYWQDRSVDALRADIAAAREYAARAEAAVEVANGRLRELETRVAFRG